MIGQTIAHYEIVEKLGEGGMGVVYKARDMHLDRFVALKLLPAGKLADPDRRLRFVQEAKAASALNHANIVTIHDIDEAAGVYFIAMEYVPGRTLDRVIGRKGLKLGEALQYAVQIADALAKAHAAGIVHRDLKPSNVIVTGDGAVKVLDFGLAKLTEPEDADDEATRTVKPRTEEGMIVGTVAYMSPEQAEGKAVDARSDIFSFGSVLYEMLTGQRAFQGETKVSTLAAVLHGQPKPPSGVGTLLPKEVESAVMRCLRKDPQRRWQTMSDLKVVLQDLKEDSDSGTLVSERPAQPPRARRPLLLLMPAAALVLAAVAALMWWRSTRVSPPQAELSLSKFTFDTGLTAYPAISPDGKLAAYASDRGGEGHTDIWVQHVAGRQPIRLTRHPARDWQPCFSPDGSRIVFRSERDGGGIYAIDALGGEERKLTGRGMAPLYSPDGSWISYIEMPAYPGWARMYLLPAAGGQPKPFLPEFGVVPPPSSAGPVWSPDGKYLLFKGMKGTDAKTLDWWVAPLDGGAAVPTGAEQSFAALKVLRFPVLWTPDGVIFAAGVSVEGVNLFQASFARGAWRMPGPAVRLTSGTGMLYNPSLARDGRLLVANITWVPSHWSAALNANQPATDAQIQQVTREAVTKLGVSLSRDGSKLAYRALGSMGMRRVEIRLRELATSQESSVPLSGVDLDAPVLSADGSLLAFRDTSEGKASWFIAQAGGSARRQVCDTCRVLAFFSDPDLALVLDSANRLVRKNLATGEESRLPEAKNGSVVDARPSWDDRWLAVLVGKEDGAAALYAVPAAGAEAPDREWVAIAEDARALACPRWSPDGNVLYYLSGRDDNVCVWAQRLDPATKRPAGPPSPVQHLHTARNSFQGPAERRAFDVARDKMVLLLNEMTGNLWTANLPQR